PVPRNDGGGRPGRLRSGGPDNRRADPVALAHRQRGARHGRRGARCARPPDRLGRSRVRHTGTGRAVPDPGGGCGSAGGEPERGQPAEAGARAGAGGESAGHRGGESDPRPRPRRRGRRAPAAPGSCGRRRRRTPLLNRSRRGPRRERPHRRDERRAGPRSAGPRPGRHRADDGGSGMSRLMRAARRGIMPLAVVAGSLALLGLGLAGAGYDAPLALGAMWRGAFGSFDAFASATLVRSIPLIIIGLGFALALRGGMLNIGAEGQFYAGAIAAAWIGIQVAGWPMLLAIPATWIGAFAAGLLWIVVPVLLRVRFGVLEVISTLLLNFVAEALVSYMVQGPMQESGGIYPQSDRIAASAQLPLLPGTRLH